MYSAIASSSSIASVGVVGAVIAASIDAMSDSRDAGVKLAPSRREAHGEKPARERRVHLFATGAHARSAGGGRRADMHTSGLQELMISSCVPTSGPVSTTSERIMLAWLVRWARAHTARLSHIGTCA